ncbi:hypothetical protein AVEN_90978-1 [Araneus ventricosus]|uniref:Uncharacterized protein n=1 Tax=Araneus ventricosus TaxID=182803 RepID=A0A4Y2VF11_ARAVE|nr:hypothetical protein AVEN_90978-1 [Araneus ventricosus]
MMNCCFCYKEPACPSTPIHSLVFNICVKMELRTRFILLISILFLQAMCTKVMAGVHHYTTQGSGGKKSIIKIF